MICVEDYLDALDWAGKFGLDGLIKKSQGNLKVVADWVAKTDWIEFLADNSRSAPTRLLPFCDSSQSRGPGR